jgi:hypothetical protein
MVRRKALDRPRVSFPVSMKINSGMPYYFDVVVCTWIFD